VFKYEKELEVWSYKGGTYELIKTYNICGLSGGFGPKRYEGDLQVPEGIYEITRLNPHSNYHKAIKINYPNKSDSILSPYIKKGGEIYTKILYFIFFSRSPEKPFPFSPFWNSVPFSTFQFSKKGKFRNKKYTVLI
jgi:hypothetical protein